MTLIKFYIRLCAVLFLLSIGLVLTNCKSTKETPQKALAVPDSYSSQKDSANTASINWKQFFSDTALERLIDTALVKNQDLLIALQRIEMARANVRMQKGAMLPTVNGAPTFGQSKYGLYTMDGAGNITTDITPGQIVPIHLPDYFLGLQTSWEVDIRGKLKNKKKAALAQYLASVEGRNWAITSLITEITTAYYELLALDNELDIVRETIVLQENALKVVTTQKSAGAANELAVEQFEAQMLNSKKLEIEILQLITETENRINFLGGSFPKSLNRNKSLFANGVPAQVKLGVPSDLLKNRPDIRQAEYELTASKANVKAARAAFYPSLNITGSLGFQAFNTAYLFTTPESGVYKLFGNLVAPLINRSAIKAEFNSAKASQLEALYSYQKTIINGYVEVYNEMVRVKNLELMFDLKSREVNVLTKSISTSSLLFQTGRANYLELLLTQRNALQSRLELVNVKKRQYNTVINLYKALGGGWR